MSIPFAASLSLELDIADLQNTVAERRPMFAAWIARIEKAKKQKKLANRITYIDLSTDPNYMDQYTAALFMPHTNKDLFPTLDYLHLQ